LRLSYHKPFHLTLEYVMDTLLKLNLDISQSKDETIISEIVEAFLEAWKELITS